MTASTVAQRTIPGGKIYFDLLNAALVKTGERYLGLTPGFTLSIASDKIQSYSAENGMQELDDETLVKITRTGKLTVRQISMENLGMFVAGQANVAAQSSGDVTNEAALALADRYLQLGATIPNPSGVRSVSAVTVAAAAPANWAATTAKAVGAQVQQLVSPTHIFQCTAAGTTAASAPTWVTTIGGATTDGTVTWTCIGILAPQATTDYTVDLTLGRIYILPTARVHPSLPVNWLLGYTKSAVSREQLLTSGTADVYGAFRFIAANAKGANRDVYGSNVLLAPSGDIVFKADSPAYAELSFDLSFNVGVNGEPALIIDGRAV
jgi:hypothetical protein